MVDELTREQAEANSVEAGKVLAVKQEAVSAATIAFVANPSDMSLLGKLTDAKRALDSAERIVSRAQDAVDDALDSEREEERAIHTRDIHDRIQKAASKSGAIGAMVIDSAVDGTEALKAIEEELTRARAALALAGLKRTILDVMDSHVLPLAELGWAKTRIEVAATTTGESAVSVTRVKKGASGPRKPSTGNGTRARKLFGPEKQGSRDYCYSYADNASVVKCQAAVDDPSKSASFTHLATATAAKLGHDIVDA